MGAERWELIERLFHEATGLEENDREQFLERACEGDEALRREIESLLEQHQKVEGFLEGPAPRGNVSLAPLLEDELERLRAATVPGRLAGQRLGPYELKTFIAAGGMGEVYRAVDTRLGRDVAIKALPASASAADAERARLLREARILSGLNHPHICTLYDIGSSDGLDYLVMEYVEGETLQSRLSRGPLPVPRVLKFSLQIADALDAAHRHGIIHRDLKPANVMIATSGVKLLDFGIARQLVAGANRLLVSSTGELVTRDGAVIGTLPYAAPEQLEGGRTDQRTDIFACGAILHEMLTGVPAFRGDNPAQQMGAILRDRPTPDLDTIPDLPPLLVRAVQRCLAKSPDDRWQSAADLLFVLQTIAGHPESAAVGGPMAGERASDSPDADAEPFTRRPSDAGTRRPSARPWMYAAVGFTIGALTVASVAQFRARPPATPTPISFQEPAWDRHGSGLGPLHHAVPPPFAISPDGRLLATSTGGEDSVMRLWVRTLSAHAPKPLPGTETLSPPLLIWSPDSSVIAFDTTGSGALKKVSLTGGAPQKVCDLTGTAVGGSWNRDGVIIVGNPTGGIMQCPAAGGAPTPVTRTSASEAEIHLFPSFLSDGRHFIYLRVSRTTPEHSGAYVTELNAASPGAGKRLFTTGFAAAYVPSIDARPGLIVFGRDGALFAQRFDEQRLDLTGEPLQLADRVGSFLDYAYFSASATTLVYKAPEPASQLTWFDRNGREVGRIGSPEHIAGLALSPEGDRAIVARHAPQNTVDQDLWLYDLTRGANPRRMTSAPTLEFFPVWRTNDRFVYTAGGGETGIYQQAVGGERELLFNSGFWEDVPTSVSADGSVLLYSTLREPTMRLDVWVRAAQSASADDGVPLIRREFDQGQAQISPDQRWVAYVSNEAGPNEVFVAELRFDPASGNAAVGDGVLVSKGGGFAPRWRGDGRELYYLRTEGSVMAVEVNAAPALTPGATTQLFRLSHVIPEWGVTNDGRRFLFAVPVSSPEPFNIIRDWQAALSK